eukprot:scpid46301/ scgid16039/ 
MPAQWQATVSAVRRPVSVIIVFALVLLSPHHLAMGEETVPDALRTGTTPQCHGLFVVRSSTQDKSTMPDIVIVNCTGLPSNCKIKAQEPFLYLESNLTSELMQPYHCQCMFKEGNACGSTVANTDVYNCTRIKEMASHSQNQCLPRPIVVRGVESSVLLSILTNPVFVNGSTTLTCMVTSLSTVQSMSIVRKCGSQSTVIKILDAGNFMPPVLNPETKVWHNSVSYLVPNVQTTAKYACSVAYFGGVQNISLYALLQAVPRQTAELHECKTIVEQQLCEQGNPGEQLCETFKQQICFDGYPLRHCNYSLQLELLARSKAFVQSFEVHIGIQDQESYAMNNNSAHISPFVFYTLGGELHVPNHDTDATVYKLHGHHPGQTLQLFLVQEHSRKLELLCPTMAHRRDLTCCGGNATYRMDVRADRPGSERRIVLDILCHDCDTCCSPNEEMVSARVRADLYSAFPTAAPTTKITSPSADSVASSMPTVTMVTSPTTLGNITASAATGDSVASAPGIPASTPVSVQMFTQSTSPEPSTETTSPELSTETTSPELSTETTSPELSTETTSPELSTETTSPELSTETTSPE